MSLEDALAKFAAEHRFRGKGPLSLALIVTRRARDQGLPMSPDSLLTGRGGQVEGLSGEAVQRTLADHGIERVLSREGGRTSRGSMANMRAYVGFLNEHAGSADLARVEAFWIGRVRDYFAAQPFTLDLDPALSVSGAIGRLMAQVEARQRETPGAAVAGAVVQHLVGAKLDVALEQERAHHGASVNDAGGRGGDFDLGDTTVHVTTAPGEALVAKCRANLAAGRRPVIVTAPARVGTARDLAADAGLAERVDVLDWVAFLAANVFELGRFEAAGRRDALARILARYNAIVDAAERDPSLRIALA